MPREIFSASGGDRPDGNGRTEGVGGHGLNYVTATLAVKELGKQCASLAMNLAAHNSLAVGQINVFGSDEQKTTTCQN